MITILDLVYAKRPELKARDSLSLEDVEGAGFPFFCGCEGCGASMGPYNAYPSKNGFTRCSDCIDEAGGFSSPGAFFTWETFRYLKTREVTP